MPPGKDPTGKSPNESGAKLDSGKIRPRLIICDMATALQEVAKVGTFGAQKYSEGGWKSVPEAEKRYTDAMLRHILAEAAGEVVDGDSGILHAAHIAWNALALLEFKLKKTE